MGKIVLIDGNSILRKAFYHVPIQTDAGGFHINAIHGFLNVLFMLAAEEKTEYLTVVFGQEVQQDNEAESKAAPEDFREQIPVMQEILASMNVYVVDDKKLRTADLIGTIANRCAGENTAVTIVSGDRNLLQLVSETVSVRLVETGNKNTRITDYQKDDVVTVHKVMPEQYAELQALVQVGGIGEKTAADLLNTYGSMTDIGQHLNDIPQKSIREALSDSCKWEKIDAFRRSVAIDTDVECSFSVEHAKLGELDTPEAYAKLKQLSLAHIFAKFGQSSKKNEVDIDKDVKVVTVMASEDAKKIFDTAVKTGSAAIRILNVKAGNAEDYKTGASGQLFFQMEEEQDVFGCMVCGGSGKEENIYWIESSDKISAADIRQWISNMLSAEKMMISVFDVKEDYENMVTAEQHKNLLSHEVTRNIFDCKIAAYLINPLKNDYKIEDIADEYLSTRLRGWSDIFGKTDIGTAYQNNKKECLSYFAKETYVLYKAASLLEKALRLNGMEQLFRDLEMPLTYVLFDMEREGILVKPEELKVYGEALSGRIGELEKAIHAEAGEVFNINSPKQLGEILFDKMKMPGGKKTKTGYSTAADVLEKLAPEYPFVKDILEYRGLTKLKSTYAEGLAAFIKDDNKIHTNFNQTITATGRLSSTEPNLQNIPMRMELGRRIRKVFIPQDGCIFMDADYSQIELRVLAHMSDDKQLIEAYKMSEDIHRITASKVFHTPFEEVTDLQRRNAKAVNFGIVYGISSFGLSQDLSITPKEAREYIDEYFKTYPGIKRFLDKMVDDAKDKGYCETLFGRRRPVPELKSSNFNQRSFGERVAMNSPIQGTAADIIKYAMIHVYDALKSKGLKSKLILQIHDELLIETRDDEVEEVREVLSREMQNACELAVNLEIDLHTGADWYDAK